MDPGDSGLSPRKIFVVSDQPSPPETELHFSGMGQSYAGLLHVTYHTHIHTPAHMCMFLILQVILNFYCRENKKKLEGGMSDRSPGWENREGAKR